MCSSLTGRNPKSTAMLLLFLHLSLPILPLITLMDGPHTLRTSARISNIILIALTLFDMPLLRGLSSLILLMPLSTFSYLIITTKSFTLTTPARLFNGLRVPATCSLITFKNASITINSTMMFINKEDKSYTQQKGFALPSLRRTGSIGRNIPLLPNKHSLKLPGPN